MKKENSNQEAETSSKKKSGSKKQNVISNVPVNAKKEIGDNKHQVENNLQDTGSKSKPICIVIPYLAAKAKGDELIYAVRAWDAFIPDVQIVIVGDKPPWSGKDLKHIPHKSESKNPQVDVAHKMMAAIASDLVPDVFIWSNDDIFTLCPVELADIVTLKSHGLLANRGRANGVYQENAKRTLEALKKQGVTEPFDYATHTPVMMEKSSLAKVIELFGCDKEGYLVYTLYANMWFKGHRPIITKNDGRGSIIVSVYRPNPDFMILDKALKTCKWVNNNDAGWTALEPKVRTLFPDKSRFEK
jgi:hypothetical protein